MISVGCVILAVPPRAVARALEALGAAEVKCGRRVRTQPQRPVEDPQSLGRVVRRLRPDEQQVVTTVLHSNLLGISQRSRQRLRHRPGLVGRLGIPGICAQGGMGYRPELRQSVRLDQHPEVRRIQLRFLPQLQEPRKPCVVLAIVLLDRRARAQCLKLIAHRLLRSLHAQRDRLESRLFFDVPKVLGQLDPSVLKIVRVAGLVRLVEQHQCMVLLFVDPCVLPFQLEPGLTLIDDDTGEKAKERHQSER